MFHNHRHEGIKDKPCTALSVPKESTALFFREDQAVIMSESLICLNNFNFFFQFFLHDVRMENGL